MGNAIDYTNWKEEKMDGKIYYMSPSANPKHSRVIFKLALAFGNYLNGKTCEVYMDNLDIYLDEEENNYVIPDMSVLCDKNKFKDNGYHGVPSLIVEVISPTSLKRDRFEKFKLYEKFGVKEYWLVDYQGKSIEQYTIVNESYQLLNILAIVSDFDYEKRLTESEREAYTTIIRPSIFDALEIDIKEIFG
ncbi:Uma2 family endonuclease [Clostridium gasigenes]|uniref:Uma2 family endonuclease n=1 Tax=Clostridium gasigenes TaxID=94869 RepID=UPI001C0C6E01|nr:Uma2 family endonuclease [Clostridium gasigenes]MBU3107583.1 Uma2 family endonuclease [Clostridium gasigenes]